MKRIELVFRQRPVSQSELYRNIVKPARREAAIEMPQSRNDHPDDRDLDVGTRLIEDEEVEALLAWRDARRRSPARACRDGRTSSRSSVGPLDCRSASKRDGPAAAMEWSVKARFLSGPASHETDGQKLVQLGQRAQQGDSRIKVRAGTELDVFLRVLHPVQ